LTDREKMNVTRYGKYEMISLSGFGSSGFAVPVILPILPIVSSI
jgi:hypothetical protein